MSDGAYRACYVLLERGTNKSVCETSVRMEGTFADADAALSQAVRQSMAYFGDLYDLIADIYVIVQPEGGDLPGFADPALSLTWLTGEGVSFTSLIGTYPRVCKAMGVRRKPVTYGMTRREIREMRGTGQYNGQSSAA